MEPALTTLTRGAHVRARVNIERESRVEQIEVEAIVETPASMRTINTREGYVVLNPPPEVTAQDEQGNVH